jgi:hypothetical protein
MMTSHVILPCRPKECGQKPRRRLNRLNMMRSSLHLSPTWFENVDFKRYRRSETELRKDKLNEMIRRTVEKNDIVH